MRKHSQKTDKGFSLVEIALGLSLIVVISISISVQTGINIACVINKTAAGIETGSVSFEACTSANAVDPNMCPSMCDVYGSSGCVHWTGPYPRSPTNGCRHVVITAP